MREGSEEAEILSQLLLDEPEDPSAHITAAAPAAGGSATLDGPTSTAFGLQQFLDHVTGEVALHLSQA